MGTRVASAGTVRPIERHGCVEHPLAGPDPASQLELSSLRLASGAALEVGGAVCDVIVFVVSGDGRLVRPDGATPLEQGSAALVAQGDPARLVAGAGGLDAVRACAGPGCDVHAPMGPASRLEQADAVAPGSATGARSFQILYDATNGSTRATLFVGHIPPGNAPWHYHLYDEIVCILSGEGRLHLGDAVEPLAPGCAFRLRPRELHIVENTSADRELCVVALFTPAGSPSAAYLPQGATASAATPAGAP